MYGVASAYRAYRLNALQVLACGHATTAVYALIVVSHKERRRRIERRFLFLDGESVFVRAVFERQPLQFAGGVPETGQALFLMRRKEKFESHLTRLTALRRIRLYFHSLAYRVYASGYKTARARRFDDAHTARSGAVHAFEIAEGGYFHFGGFRCL